MGCCPVLDPTARIICNSTRGYHWLCMRWECEINEKGDLEEIIFTAELGSVCISSIASTVFQLRVRQLKMIAETLIRYRYLLITISDYR